MHKKFDLEGIKRLDTLFQGTEEPEIRADSTYKGQPDFVARGYVQIYDAIVVHCKIDCPKGDTLHPKGVISLSFGNIAEVIMGSNRASETQVFSHVLPFLVALQAVATYGGHDEK